MKNILIASSSVPFLERNGTLLRRSDFRILTATNSEEALAILHDEGIHLVIVDNQLDNIAGDELCSLIRSKETFRDIPIILVCRELSDDLAKLGQCGANAVMARPIRPLQLIKTVGQFLTVQLVRSKRVTLRVKVISKKDVVEFFCLSHNISVTGMLIETGFSLEIGSEILCIFNLPDGQQVETEGEVVRAARALDGSHQYGIQFTGLTRTFRRAIDAYIATVARGATGKA